MDLLFFNAWWMMFNLSLALIAIITGWIVYLTTNNFVRISLAFIWLLFLPNTLYLVTDLPHLVGHISKVAIYLQPVLIAQFFVLALLGFIAYILAVYPLDLLVSRSFDTKRPYVRYGFIVSISILSSLGIMIGRFYRIHSWETITHPLRIMAVLDEMATSSDIVLLVGLFGLWSSLFYLNGYTFIIAIVRNVYLRIANVYAFRHRQ